MLDKRLIEILVVDDEPNVRRSIQLMLQTEGYQVSLATDAIKGYESLTKNEYDLLILDIRMDGVDGLQLFRRLLKESIDVPVIFVSGNASLSEAVEAVRLGAFDFIEKPFSADRLSVTVQRCLEHESLKSSLKEYRAAVSQDILGTSKAIRTLVQDATKVAGSEANVFIQGESGTGKELVAKLIHENSGRSKRPFVKVNCSAIPETLIESELFGYERGAFTGATAPKKGLFEQANHGTLFLDEIADMSLSVQAKVLRAIQNGEIQKVGAERIIPVDVRILAASHKNLESLVEQGTFREDLYYRINVVPLRVPPLRDRAEDVPQLVDFFLQTYCSRNGFRLKKMHPSVMQRLSLYQWPGNVRELQNLIERLVIMSGDNILPHDLPTEVLDSSPVTTSESTSGHVSLKDFKEHSEREFILSTLRKAEGNVSKAAQLLSVDRTHLHKKMQFHAISKAEYFSSPTTSQARN